MWGTTPVYYVFEFQATSASPEELGRLTVDADTLIEGILVGLIEPSYLYASPIVLEINGANMNLPTGSPTFTTGIPTMPVGNGVQNMFMLNLFLHKGSTLRILHFGGWVAYQDDPPTRDGAVLLKGWSFA